MSIYVLTTKIFIPGSRAKLVARDRLVGYLRSCGGYKLILISAPAGFGKTTLLSEYSRLVDHPLAWLSVDDRDNDPSRFWIHLIAALQTTGGHPGQSAFSMLQKSPLPVLEGILSDLINELGSREQEITLVLDDYHLINKADIHRGMMFLLENLPPNLQLIVSGRADPPWPLARYRASREMVEIRAEDLRFTLDESMTLFKDVMGLDLSPRDVSILENRTEGWVVGLQMAALSMQGRDDLSGFIEAFSGSHRFILDYLMEEVLSRQNQGTQNFLLETSILEALTASLCDAVTERNDSQEMLTRLDQDNLFLVPLDDERCWYRYHHLFAELLRNQVNHLFPERVPVLHQNASRWYDGEKKAEEAIRHALSAGDQELLAGMVEKYALDFLHQSQYNLVSSWIESLPDTSIHNRPWLCVYQAWTRHWAGMREGGEVCLRAAERKLAADPAFSKQEIGILTGYIAAVRAHYALTGGNIEQVLEEGQKAIRLLPEDDYFTRGTAAVALGGAYWGMGKVREAEKAFRECADNALKGNYPYRASSALCYVGMQLVKQGELGKAHRTYQESLELAMDDRGRKFPNAGYPLAKLAELSCEWDDLEQAITYAEEGVKLCSQLGHVDLIAESYAALARVRLAWRDFPGAEVTLQEIDQILAGTEVDPWAMTWLNECRVRLWLSTGRMMQAVHWAEKKQYQIQDSFSYHHDLEHIQYARILLARGIKQSSRTFLKRALSVLERLLEAADQAGWVHEMIKIYLLQARAFHALGEHPSALEALSSALKHGEVGGYLRTFLDEGETLGKLYQQAQDMGIHPKMVSTILEVLNVGSQGELNQALTEPLTARELEVLKYLNGPLSSLDIADQLFIASSTVRTHVKSIYQKLDVHSRKEAVIRGQELNLI